MKLIEKGYLNIIKEFESLKERWCGQDSKPIKKEVLNKLRDESLMSEYFKVFRDAGFKESDISVTPISDGNIQLEAELDDRYFEITIRG